MCQYPTHIYFFFREVPPADVYICSYTQHVCMVTWPHMMRGMVLPDHVRPGVKKQVRGTVQGPNEKQAVATADCVCPLF